MKALPSPHRSAARHEVALTSDRTETLASLQDRAYARLEDEAMTAGEIAQFLGERIETAISVADRLVAKGWLTFRLEHVRADLYRKRFEVARTKRIPLQINPSSAEREKP